MTRTQHVAYMRTREPTRIRSQVRQTTIWGSVQRSSAARPLGMMHLSSRLLQIKHCITDVLFHMSSVSNLTEQLIIQSLRMSNRGMKWVGDELNWSCVTVGLLPT